MALAPKSLAGSGYVILNVLKGMNITGLLAIIAASVLMLIKTTTDSGVSDAWCVPRNLLTIAISSSSLMLSFMSWLHLWPYF